mgnify:CR=1 FL=1
MSEKSNNKLKKVDRPTSPHLTIYKPQITSVLSITHRITGVFMTVGAFVLAAWVIALGESYEMYNCVADILSSAVGRIFLLGWVFALFFHLCNGVRHLFWDAGYGFSIRAVNISGWLTILTSLFLTYLAISCASHQLGGYLWQN